MYKGLYLLRSSMLQHEAERKGTVDDVCLCVRERDSGCLPFKHSETFFFSYIQCKCQITLFYAILFVHFTKIMKRSKNTKGYIAKQEIQRNECSNEFARRKNSPKTMQMPARINRVINSMFGNFFFFFFR